MPKNRINTTSDGRYVYKVTDTAGRRISIKSTAEEKRSDFVKRCDKLDLKAAGQVPGETMDDLFDLWIDGHVKLNLSPAELRVTVPAYNKWVQPYLGHRKLADIKRVDVYNLLSRAAKKNVSASLIKKIRGCVSRPFNWAINTLGMDLVSPTQGLVFSYADAKKPSPRARAIPEDDLGRFLEAAKSSKYYNYYRIIALAGLRPSEGLGLQIRDIKDDHLEIRRGWTTDGLSKLKTDTAARDFVMTDELRQIVLEQKAAAAFKSKEGWLFPTDKRYPDMDAIQSAFKRTIAQTAIWERGGRNGLKKIRMLTPPVDFVLYDFRHTFATEMADRGMQATALKSLMGHSDIIITLKYYVDLTDKMKKEARQILEGRVL